MHGHRFRAWHRRGCAPSRLLSRRCRRAPPRSVLAFAPFALAGLGAFPARRASASGCACSAARAVNARCVGAPSRAFKAK